MATYLTPLSAPVNATRRRNYATSLELKEKDNLWALTLAWDAMTDLAQGVAGCGWLKL